MSTPRLLGLPPGVGRQTVETSRGTFAALAAVPVTGICERQPALLVPGYTGSKEDFLPVLEPLAAAGRLVIAIDMRGQYESPAAAGPDGYDIPELAADVAAIADTLRAGAAPVGAEAARVHLLGHSFGGLVAGQATLSAGAAVRSLTLMSSGPGALTGPRATVLREVLASIDGAASPAGAVRRIWDTRLEPAAAAEGVTSEVIGFLRARMLSNCPTGLKVMAENLLAWPDHTPALAAMRTATLVVYGEDDDAWAPGIQEDMAGRLGAERVCIPGAAHSPAVEAPETVAATLTAFWNAAECRQRRARS